MTFNLYRDLRGLLIDERLEAGEVTAADSGTVTVTLPGGGKRIVRGVATVGSQVYICRGVIEGPAPDLPIVEIEI